MDACVLSRCALARSARSNLVVSSVLILHFYSAGKACGCACLLAALHASADVACACVPFSSITGLISSTLLVVPRLVFWTTCVVLRDC